MSGNERASRCHSHQQKVIASRHEFDTCPLSSTISATILRISVIVALFFYCRNVRVNTRVNIRVLNESRVFRKRASENLLPV